MNVPVTTRPQGPERNRRHRPWPDLVARAVLVAMGGTLLGGCRDGQAGNVRVVIPAGATMRQAADSLAAHRVIRAPALFRLYASVTHRDRRIKAGTYLIERRASWSAVIDDLVAGKGIVFSVTIPEGWDLKAIFQAVSTVMKVSTESLDSAARDTDLVRRLGVPIRSLEGYLFPETYLLPDGATAPSIVRRLVGEFERRWKPAWDDRLPGIGMTRHQVITLASIIEKEAKRPEERPIISGVYHNRIRRGMKLQADPTVLYALGRHATRVLNKDLLVDSRYNTYRYAGLPPGPIASPGIASIEAALFPANVPYLYFVAYPDGHHEFRATLREHNEAVRRMRALRRATGSPP